MFLSGKSGNGQYLWHANALLLISVIAWIRPPLWTLVKLLKCSLWNSSENEEEIYPHRIQKGIEKVGIHYKFFLNFCMPRKISSRTLVTIVSSVVNTSGWCKIVLPRLLRDVGKAKILFSHKIRRESFVMDYTLIHLKGKMQSPQYWLRISWYPNAWLNGSS